MKKTALLLASILAVLSWSPPTDYTDGTPITWDTYITYMPATSPYPGGPWTDQPVTELLWATVPDPGSGQTLYYTCRAIINGQISDYAMPVSKTVPATTKGYGKGGKKK